MLRAQAMSLRCKREVNCLFSKEQIMGAFGQSPWSLGRDLRDGSLASFKRTGFFFLWTGQISECPSEAKIWACHYRCCWLGKTYMYVASLRLLLSSVRAIVEYYKDSKQFGWMCCLKTTVSLVPQIVLCVCVNFKLVCYSFCFSWYFALKVFESSVSIFKLCSTYGISQIGKLCCTFSWVNIYKYLIVLLFRFLFMSSIWLWKLRWGKQFNLVGTLHVHFLNVYINCLCFQWLGWLGVCLW